MTLVSSLCSPAPSAPWSCFSPSFVFLWYHPPVIHSLFSLLFDISRIFLLHIPLSFLHRWMLFKHHSIIDSLPHPTWCVLATHTSPVTQSPHPIHPHHQFQIKTEEGHEEKSLCLHLVFLSFVVSCLPLPLFSLWVSGGVEWWFDVMHLNDLLSMSREERRKKVNDIEWKEGEGNDVVTDRQEKRQRWSG